MPSKSELEAIACQLAATHMTPSTFTAAATTAPFASLTSNPSKGGREDEEQLLHREYGCGGRGCDTKWVWTWIENEIATGKWPNLLEPTTSHTPAGVKVHEDGG